MVPLSYCYCLHTAPAFFPEESQKTNMYAPAFGRKNCLSFITVYNATEHLKAWRHIFLMDFILVSQSYCCFFIFLANTPPFMKSNTLFLSMQKQALANVQVKWFIGKVFEDEGQPRHQLLYVTRTFSSKTKRSFIVGHLLIQESLFKWLSLKKKVWDWG